MDIAWMLLIMVAVCALVMILMMSRGCRFGRMQCNCHGDSAAPADKDSA